MNSIGKSQDIIKINEGIFNNIFKKSEPIILQLNGKGGASFINPKGVKNTIKKFSDTKYNAHLQNWWIENLSWLYNAEFKAEELQFNNDRVYFSGIWVSGDFGDSDKKYVFKGYNSQFLDGRFFGEFYLSPNLSFKTSPSNFYTGTFDDNLNGIIGQTDANFGKYTSGGFSLIQIPVNSVLILKDGSKNTYKIKLIKRLDENSEAFIFEVIAEKSTKITIPWETIRKKLELNTANIAIGQPFPLPEIISAREITFIELMSEEDYYESASTVLKEDTINFQESDPRLKIPYTVEFEFSTPEEYQKFKVLKEQIENGTFYSILSEIRALIKTGVINGHLNYTLNKDFIDLFNGQVGNPSPNKEEAAKVNKLLQYTYFIMENMFGRVKGFGKRTLYLYFKKWLKEFLGVDSYIKPIKSTIKTPEVQTADVEKEKKLKI